MMTRRHNQLGSVPARSEARSEAISKPTPEQQPEPARRSIDGVVVARLLALRSDGKAMVEVVDPAGLDQRLRQPIFATYLPALTARHIGRRVALLFEQGDPGRPVIVAVMHEAVEESDVAPAAPVTVALDGDELHLDARREIVLSCG